MILEKEKLPRNKGILALCSEVAVRLNQEGNIPLRGREYTMAIVQSHHYKRINDPLIEAMIKKVAVEWNYGHQS